MSLEPNIALQRFSGPLEMENAFLQGLPSAEKWPVEKQIFTCPVCLFSCDTCSRLKAHFQQTDHKPTSQKMVVQSHMCKMSDKDQIPSTSTKKLLFCEVCQIACVTEERQKLHKESEKHKLMEEFENGDKTYKTLEEFIVCPKRSYPVIGLQYIVQWRTDVTSSKAFECRICKTSLNLKNMIKHITSYKHSINYMAEHYSYLFPLFKSFQTFPVRNFQVKTRAKVIEVKEATCKKQVSQNKPEEGVLKNDFHKYTIELHKKSSERAKGKQEVMDFLNTFNIESQKEVEEVQELKDKLEDVINVFCRYTERRGPKRYSKRKASEGETVTLPSKKKYLWDEKLPSKIPCATSSHSETKTPDKSSGSNNPISSTVCSSDLLDFVTEEEQEQNETVQPSTSASSLTDANITSTNADSADMTKASQVIIKKETPEGIRPKHPWVTRKSTGFEYGIWSSLTNKDDQNMSFSCPLSSKFPNPSVPSLFDNLNVDPAEENDDHEVKKKRRESTEVLATFTLFSQGRRGRNSSVSATSQSSFIKEKSSRVVKNDHDLQNDENKSGSPNEDIPQTIEQSSALYDHDEGLDTNADEELDHNSDLKYDPFHSDLESNPDEHIILDEYTDENTEGVDENVQEESMLQTDENTCSDEHSNLKDLLDEQCEGQGNRLPVDDVASSPVSKTPRKMNRDVLKRFKGKDVEVISDLLKTVSPYYEELQHVDLLEVAKVVSETGTFIGMND